eukprot:scaffold244225_cov45-Attheya_sp.AAC.2
MMTNTPVINSTPTSPGIFAQLPDVSLIESSHKANLNIPGLPAAASECHIFPALTSDLVLKGVRCPDNGFWSIPTPPTNQANNVTTSVTRTIADRIAFYHVTMFSKSHSLINMVLKLELSTQEYLVTFIPDCERD